MDKRNYKQIGLFLALVLLVAGAALYYYKFYKKSFEEPDYYSQENSIFLKLKENPDYLIREDLLKVQSVPLMEYFRTRMLYHTYENPSSPRKKLEEEIELNFPGERGRVLIEILSVYLKFEKEIEKVKEDTDLDEYEKILKIDMVRYELFGEKLVPLFYPPKDSDKIEKFYAYTNRYLKKHYTDMARSKKNHLLRARQEIYGSDYDRVYAQESFNRKLELELKINEREMSIMNDFEKQQTTQLLRENLLKSEN